ncbi:hypothetical protein DJ528_11755, partial [Sulfolobus sp. B5]
MLLKKKRNSLEITITMLEACTDGINKTKLMYKVNLSTRPFNKYLNQLVKSGYIKREGNLYKLTEKGMKYLQRAREYLELAKKLE